jgi:dipeptidyl aminopeptidase/acylaminoacyl peptidase
MTNDPSIDSNSSWSPDGNQLAFWSDHIGTPNIFLIKRDGSQPIILTNNLDLFTENPSWSSDGKQIVFHAAPLETGAPKLIRENLNWIFVGIVGVIALVIIVRLARRNRKVTSEEHEAQIDSDQRRFRNLRVDYRHRSLAGQRAVNEHGNSASTACAAKCDRR